MTAKELIRQLFERDWWTVTEQGKIWKVQIMTLLRNDNEISCRAMRLNKKALNNPFASVIVSVSNLWETKQQAIQHRKGMK